MKDAARAYTDRELERLEKELERAYARAKADITAEWDAYAAKHGQKLGELANALERARMGGNAAEIEKARQMYQREAERLTRANKAFKAEINKLSEKLARVDKEAYAMANHILPDVYCANYNDIPIPRGYVFNLVNPETVRNLTFGDFQLLKDTRWNRQRLNAEILQGILRGESMDKIGKRLLPMVDGNKAAAIRNARTAVTYAENQGRLDSMRSAADIGLVYEKQWVATHDERTRESHLEIDGERVTLYEAFSNGCQCPADPHGDPAEVYNCRCTMLRVLAGIRGEDGEYHEWRGGNGG